MARSFTRGHWLWAGPLFFATGSSFALLFSLGAKGAEISAILSLATGIVSMIFTVLGYVSTTRRPSVARAAAKTPPWAKKLLIGAVVAVLGFLAALSWWLVIHKPDINIIDQIPARVWPDTKANSTISIKVPGNPPERRYLALRFALTNHSPVGDCVVPAHFYVVPGFDRRGKVPIDGTVRATKEMRLDIGEATGRVEVKFILVEPDLECTVDVRLVEAILYN